MSDDKIASTISPELSVLKPEVQGLDSDKSLVVCLSGGLDSSLVIGWYLKERDYLANNIYPIFVDYGQKWVAHEQEAVEKVCKYWKTQDPLFVRRQLGIHDDYIPEYDVSKQLKGYIPMRNIHIFGLAVDYVLDLQKDGIDCSSFTSGSRFSPYPDTTVEFIDRYNFMLSVGIYEDIFTEAPFAWWGSKRIYRYAEKLDFPIDITSSCQLKNDPPFNDNCGICQKCQERRKYNRQLRLDPV